LHVTRKKHKNSTVSPLNGNEKIKYERFINCLKEFEFEFNQFLRFDSDYVDIKSS